MQVFEKGKAIQIVMNNNETLKVIASAEKGDVIIIECKDGKLITKKEKNGGGIK